MGTVEKAQKALEEYKSLGKMPIVENPQGNDFGVYQCVFEDLPEAWEYITLQEAEHDAEWCLNNFKKEKENGRNSLMKIIALNLYSSVKIIQEINPKHPVGKIVPELCKKIIEIWLNKFKTFNQKENLKNEFERAWKEFGRKPIY